MSETTQGRFSIFVNGRTRQVGGSMTIGKLAASYNLDPRQMLVELNGQTLLRDEWPERTLEHGDRVEFIRVVAGG
jgi:thiamine biosynthesis protein ThiS